ncbi:M55 family metallopeptidase [Cohnella thailandensis]|uniref:M55 family metallopeptidase n=1 Tax=Cohnella thailandensis TaxID=557557 RepID=A0A841SV01_9BACL|nr:M55 family metallopeptidase [Cohnella thailandensis]MBB6634819.1 M55 family metallopeptidase [Cohnella thailandensis]MBP1975960.1 D-amino peptidase [Cohnella thailandensis]
MKYIIITDLEGAAGVDSFGQTRTTDPVAKEAGMRQLTLEANACVAGIRKRDPNAEIDAIDGHGTGGLHPEDLIGCRYVNLAGTSVYRLLEEGSYDAMLFVGQHAMAGTVAAPLNHTYSSLDVMYYRLNDVFIGEFGARAVLAGSRGVPVIFLSGDDKAAAEARMFIPGIETAVTKRGTGIERAEHLSSEQACTAIREGASRAVARMAGIPPYRDFQAPYTLEIRYYRPIADGLLISYPDAVLIDERTVSMTVHDPALLPL